MNKTTYHAMFDDDGVASILLRLRNEDGELHGETYRPGEGWVRSDYAFDVMRNGQDYDLVDPDDVAAVTAAMDEAEVGDEGSPRP